MNESQLRDLTRKAMIREYLHLRDKTISIVDASNQLFEFIETNYENDPDLQNLLDKFDRLVDNTNL